MNLATTIVYTGLLVCALFGLIYLRVWLSSRRRLEYLFFAITSLLVAVYAAAELKMMHAETPEDYDAYLKWNHVVAWASYVSFMLFIRFYLKPRRAWIFWTGITLRTVALATNLLLPVSINFTEVTAMKQVQFLGEALFVPVGTRNPLMAIGQAGTVWILLYCVDAAAGVWRRGDRKLALWVGGSSVLFIGGRLLDTVLVFWGIVEFPLTVSPFFVGLTLAMGYKLSIDATRSQQLLEELEDEKEITSATLSSLEIATSAGHVGVWIRERDSEAVWANNAWREIFGFGPDESITVTKLRARIHPDDRPIFDERIENIAGPTGTYALEYRVIRPDGEKRWIASRGKLEHADRKPSRIFGASADITDLKNAEEAIHELGGRLIGAREAERSRLARELHDDLSQRLAFLSIELDLLKNPANSDINVKIQKLSDDVKAISSDVHRMSHELHPAPLERLGLVGALKVFVSEFSEVHRLPVELGLEDVPETIRNETALCVYRVVQEALHNVEKHSAASSAGISLRRTGEKLRLEITDNGKGFDIETAEATDSIGLTAMRERVTAANGHFKIESQRGRGTTVIATIPLDESNNSE